MWEYIIPYFINFSICYSIQPIFVCLLFQIQRALFIVWLYSIKNRYSIFKSLLPVSLSLPLIIFLSFRYMIFGKEVFQNMVSNTSDLYHSCIVKHKEIMQIVRKMWNFSWIICSSDRYKSFRVCY